VQESTELGMISARSLWSVVFITATPNERHEYEMFILNAMDEFSEGTRDVSS